MPAHDLFVVYLISFLLVMLPSYGLYKLFIKAGLPGWKAFVPFYNTWVMQQTAKRPTYWAILQLVPIAGWFITMGIFIEWVKLFGKFSLGAHTLSAFVPFLYFPYIAPQKDTRFIGADAVKKNYKKTGVREWVDAGVFAVVAATLIRTFVFEAYTIPTGSMEKTLLINDFLFVSKLTYGPRIPNTPLSVPFVHATLPGGLTKSYVEWIKIPYTRWFASPVKRNDVVVFNFPAGDTMINKEGYLSERPFYQVCRFETGNGNLDAGRKVILENPDQYPLVVRPVDKRENYVKRCVAIAGDSLQIKDGILFINGVAAPIPPKSEMYYEVETNGQQLDPAVMKEEYDIDMENTDKQELVPNTEKGKNNYLMLLTTDAKEKIVKSGLAKSIHLYMRKERTDFPYDTIHTTWAVDNYGPLWVPKKDAKITLTPENYSLYDRIINVYEHNTSEWKDGKLYINGVATNEYTFKMNYYWMMGDNRHGSQDSRFWGFVPEDHVVGEAWLIWMSWDHGVRWSRLFRRIH
ncbi:MAG: S26 family signal peptidase [Chitinophagaceae bacterium]